MMKKLPLQAWYVLKLWFKHNIPFYLLLGCTICLALYCKCQTNTLNVMSITKVSKEAMCYQHMEEFIHAYYHQSQEYFKTVKPFVADTLYYEILNTIQDTKADMIDINIKDVEIKELNTDQYTGNFNYSFYIKDTVYKYKANFILDKDCIITNFTLININEVV